MKDSQKRLVFFNRKGEKVWDDFFKVPLPSENYVVLAQSGRGRSINHIHQPHAGDHSSNTGPTR